VAALSMRIPVHQVLDGAPVGEICIEIATQDFFRIEVDAAAGAHLPPAFARRANRIIRTEHD
jgi:hypothetical protein